MNDNTTLMTRKRELEEKLLPRLGYKERNLGREHHQNKEWERRVPKKEQGGDRGRDKKGKKTIDLNVCNKLAYE